MAEFVYIKAPPGHAEKKRKFRERSFSFLMLSIGLAAVAFAVWPLLAWQFVTLPKLTAKVEEFPVPFGKIISRGSVAGTNIQVVQEQDGFSYFVTDFKPQGKRPQEFLISIPKLEIEKAKVKVDAVKFDKNLALFPGSAIPVINELPTSPGIAEPGKSARYLSNLTASTFTLAFSISSFGTETKNSCGLLPSGLKSVTK